MIRSKGLLDIPDVAVEMGVLHEVAIPHKGDIFLYEGQPAAELADALEAGKAVIHPDYLEGVRLARRHEFYPGKMIEVRRSAHGVSFGRLVGPVPRREHRMGTVLNVAMKPFRSADKAINEMLGYEVLQSLGIETFSPVGVFPSKSLGNSIVLTEKRNDFQSLDRDEWVVGRRVENERDMEISERNTRTVKEISALMAKANLNGVFLPDGQIKNYAITNYGRVGAIDTENLITRDLLHPDTATLAVENIEKLVKSLVTDEADSTDEGNDKIFGVGMLAHMSTREARNSCDELIISPYVEALMDLTNGDGIDLIQHEQATVLAEGVMHILGMDDNWPTDLSIPGSRSSGS